MSSYTYLIQQVSFYYGIPVLIGGIVGGFLNTIVFLSLQTFRQNSCAFYLLIMSIVNIGQLFTGLLSRILISGYNIDWTETSAFYCKFRYFLLQFCTLVSLTCICLATIDQYFATSSDPQRRQWNQLKIAHRAVLITILIWFLHGIVYLVFFTRMYSVGLRRETCLITNSIFARYHAYGYFLILTGFLPITIKVLFAILSFRNIRHTNRLGVPIVRRELDKQLTIMVLVQVAINALTLLPSNIIAAIRTNDSSMSSQLQFAYTICLFIYYFTFVVSSISEFENKKL